MKNKWFCIGQSGATIDGRHIEANVLKEMAESYEPAKYGARLNIEHYRPFFPGSEGGGYGDVLELKAETVDKEVKLFARLDPTEKMLNLLKNREKVFTSMEIIKNFADTGKAYLVGLALTDSPASLGTSMLQFSLESQPQTFVSNYIQMKEEAMSQETAKQPGIFDRLKQNLFATPEPKTEPQEELADQDLLARVGKAETELTAAGEVVEKVLENYAKLQKEHTELAAEFAEFRAAVEAAPVNSKPEHTGFTGKAKSDF